MNKTEELIKSLDDDYVQCDVCKKHFLKKEIIKEHNQSEKNSYKVNKLIFHFNYVCRDCNNTVNNLKKEFGNIKSTL